QDELGLEGAHEERMRERALPRDEVEGASARPPLAEVCDEEGADLGEGVLRAQAALLCVAEVLGQAYVDPARRRASPRRSARRAGDPPDLAVEGDLPAGLRDDAE